jgi:hypothetical protein
MGQRSRALIGTLSVALGLGPGCVHVHTDADGKVRSVEVKVTESPEPAKAPAAASTAATAASKADPAVKPAGATVPVPAAAVSASPIAKLMGKGTPAKDAATDIAVTWQNKIAYLRDPYMGGVMRPGIVGQMFLFGPGYQPAPVNGKLVIEIFDETKRPGGPTEPRRVGSWTFDKDTLRKLMTMDDKFGKSYALFLPWPDYNPSIALVRLDVRYEQEHGDPLLPLPSKLAIDTSTPGGPIGDGGGLAGMGPRPGSTPPGGGSAAVPAAYTQPAVPAVALPPLNPLPIGGGPALPPGALTTGVLQPLPPAGKP